MRSAGFLYVVGIDKKFSPDWTNLPSEHLKSLKDAFEKLHNEGAAILDEGNRGTRLMLKGIPRSI